MKNEKSVREIVLASDLYKSGVEFTTTMAHELVPGRNKVSTSTTMNRMAKIGEVEKRVVIGKDTVAYFKAKEVKPVPANIAERIMGCQTYLSGTEFTAATLQSRLRDASKGGISFALNKLHREGEIFKVRTMPNGRGQRENVWAKASKNLGILSKSWVSEPSPTEYTPKYS
jgi:hypothetical protein